MLDLKCLEQRGHVGTGAILGEVELVMEGVGSSLVIVVGGDGVDKDSSTFIKAFLEGGDVDCLN